MIQIQMTKTVHHVGFCFEHWALDFDHLLCVNEQWKMLNDKWFGCGQSLRWRYSFKKER